MILEQCKGVYCVDLGESFQTHIYLQNLASIQPRTSPLKFAVRRRPARSSGEKKQNKRRSPEDRRDSATGAERSASAVASPSDAAHTHRPAAVKFVDDAAPVNGSSSTVDG